MYRNPIRALILSLIAGSLATAADFSFSGSLAADNDIQLFRFSLASTNSITLRTYSYAGGTNELGAAVPRGGFDPVLALFNSTGTLINEDDDGYGNVPADSVTGQHWDSYIQTTLAAGTYIVSLTQYENFPNGPTLSDGFSRTGQPKFTSAFGCSNGGFCDRTADNRTANWQMEILDTVSATAVPEPNAPALLAIGTVFVGAFCSRKFWRNFLDHKSR